MTSRSQALDANDIVRRYRAGESEKALAAAYGVSRGPIRRVLLWAGVEPRGRKEAMLTRMAQASADERKRLARAANEARRGSSASDLELARKAECRARIVGRFENEVLSRLRDADLSAVGQQPVGPYNLDVACWPVAIEVHRHTGHPSRQARLRKRSVYLAECGWKVLYLWVTPDSKSAYRDQVTDAAYDKVVAHVQAAQRDPASVREYRVIRGAGQDAP